MAKNTQLSNATVNKQAQDIVNDLDTGYCRIYEGPQPANADIPLSGQVLVVELRFKSPSAPSPIDGVINFNNMNAVNGLATGQAAWFRCLKSDGVSVVMDGSVGRTNANMTLINTLIVIGALVTITNFQHTVEKSASGF